MSDLFVNLYRYRQREKKENQEDWLTECLAATFRSLSAKQLSRTLSTLTGQPLSAIEPIATRITIETQVTIDRQDSLGLRQRPDMLIRVDKQPWLLFENKVAHTVGLEVPDRAIKSQLHRYAEWLQEQKFEAAGLNRALIFVTHHTPVPPDFLSRDNPHPLYAGLGRAATSWGRICRIMESVIDGADETSFSHGLVAAYHSYLESKGMLNEYPRYKDVATLGAYIEVADSLVKLVNDMFQRLEGVSAFSRNTVWAYHNSEEGTLSAFRYLAATAKIPAKTWIQTGLWFPDLSDGWFRDDLEGISGSAVTSTPKVFLLVGNEDDNQLSGLSDPDGGEWHRPNTDLFAFRDFATFAGDPNERATAIFSWLDLECARLKSVLAG